MEFKKGLVFEYIKDPNYRVKITRIIYGIRTENNTSKPNVVYAKVLSKGVSALEKNQEAGWPFSIFRDFFVEVKSEKKYDRLIKELKNGI